MFFALAKEGTGANLQPRLFLGSAKINEETLEKQWILTPSKNRVCISGFFILIHNYSSVDISITDRFGRVRVGTRVGVGFGKMIES